MWNYTKAWSYTECRRTCRCTWSCRGRWQALQRRWREHRTHHPTVARIPPGFPMNYMFSTMYSPNIANEWSFNPIGANVWRTSAWYLAIVSLYHPSQQPPHNICFEHRKENQPQEADLGAKGRSVSMQLSPLCTEHFSVISFNFRSKATLATVTIVQNMYQTINRTIDSMDDGCQ